MLGERKRFDQMIWRMLAQEFVGERNAIRNSSKRAVRTLVHNRGQPRLGELGARIGYLYRSRVGRLGTSEKPAAQISKQKSIPARD